MYSSTAILALTMLLSHSASATALPALAAPLKETAPWLLSKIEIFEANSGTSSVSFHFVDANQNLAVATDCTHTAAAGTSLYGDTYHYCADSQVAYKIKADKTIGILKTWVDPTVGTADQDTVTGFGKGQLSLHLSESHGGVKYTQDSIEISCEETIA